MTKSKKASEMKPQCNRERAEGQILEDRETDQNPEKSNIKQFFFW